MAYKTIYIRRDSVDKYETLENKAAFFNWCLNLPCWQIQKKTKFPAASGIYFIVDDENRLLYIGKTGNLKNRFVNHHRIEQFENTRVFLFQTTELESEDAFIESLNPKLNNSSCKSQRRGDRVIHQVYMEKDLFERLEKIAVEEGRSISSLIVYYINEQLKAREYCEDVVDSF